MMTIGISIDGDIEGGLPTTHRLDSKPTDGTVVRDVDGHNADAIAAAFDAAIADKKRPTHGLL